MAMMKKDTPKQKARKENRQIRKAERMEKRDMKLRAKDTTGTMFEPKLTKRDIRKFSK